MGKSFFEARNVLAVILSISAAPALATKTPGPDAFSYYERNDQTGETELHRTNTPFLGEGVEALGTFEIQGLTFKQKTFSRVTNHGDLCTRNRERLDRDDQQTAERYCGTRVWAYRSQGQVYLFKADAAEATLSRLNAAILSGTRWSHALSIREAQDTLGTTHIVRGFEVPSTELRRKAYLQSAARTNEVYAFCGETEPGQVIDTGARSFAWNTVFIIAGGTLNPLYEIYLPKPPRRAPQTPLTKIKVVQRETFSVLFIPSDFTTEYKLERVEAP